MKKVSLFFVSLALMLCLAFGMTACGGKKDPKDPPSPPDPPTPPTPTVTVDVNNANMIQNEVVTVTATVANSEKAAAFSLAAEGETVVALQVDENAPNVAKLTARADGQTTLTVALEGAQPVTVPVKVDGVIRVNGDLADQTRVFDAKTTGEDDGETTTFTVRHFMGADYKLDVTNGNENVASMTENNGTYTLKALQAGVSDINVTLSAAKEETPDPQPEQPETQAEEGEEQEPEYEVKYSKTLGFVCTDDWNKLAEKEASTKLISYKEIKDGETVVGYAAYIDRTKGDELDVQDSNGVLRIPAVYNRKPVVSLVKNQEGVATSYFLAYEAGSKKTQDQIDALETDDAKAKAEADNAIIEAYEAIYNKISEVYLPCTLTSIPDLTFRLAKVAKIEVQKGNHIASIGVQAFNEVNNLTSLNLEDCRELKTIKNRAFTNNGNAGLSIIIPNCVETIENKAFATAKFTKIEFEIAKKNAAGEYVPSVSFTAPGMNTGSGIFMGVEAQKIVLRNFKTAIAETLGVADYFMQTAKCGMLVIGEDIKQANIDLGWFFLFSFMPQDPPIEQPILFEGAENDVISNIAAKAGEFIPGAGWVDNCGVLLGTPSFPAATFGQPNVIYIHKDIVSADKVSAYVKTMFQQDETFEGTGEFADYTKWTRK